MHKYVYLDTYAHPLGSRNVEPPLFNNVPLYYLVLQTVILFIYNGSLGMSKLLIGVTVLSVLKCNIKVLVFNITKRPSIL